MAPATLVASGRVPKAQKLRVDAKVRRMGLSPSDNIQRVYEYMDAHDSFPWLEDEPVDGTSLLEEFDAMVAAIPAGRGLANLSRADMKARYRERA